LPHGLLRCARNDVALTPHTRPRSRRAFRASFAWKSRPHHTEGAVLPPEGSRECRTLGASAAACAVVESTRVSHHGHAGNVRHSPRNGFNGFLRALPGDRACLPPSPPRSSASRELDASVGASGPHDFAVRKPSAFVNALLASTASCPASVTISSRPSVGQDGGDKQAICVRRKRKYFCKRDWTAQITLIPRENFSSRRVLES
jgi:hypothetical protein